jgi:hypothetical protein
VRAEPDELKSDFVRLAIDQNEVRPHVAIAMIAPFAREWVIEVATRQRLIRSQKVHPGHKEVIKALAVPPRFLSPVIPLESAGVFNSPHSGWR